MNRNISLYLCLILLVCCTACQQADTLFVAQKNTGITFQNTITENDTFNILDYEYVYNGGGVGIADFNGDGLQDVVLTGNMVASQLYLNKGNWKFEEVSEAAGLFGENRWNSGVAICDVNTDGLPDIYVCATTYQPAARRANQLYINQGTDEKGVPRFQEMAQEYRLADTSHTTNAAFFDYDKDGDLDVYLLVNEMDETKQPNRYRKKIVDGSSARTDKLLRNDFDTALGHSVFTDVSAEAGILIEGFGLGVNICDLNRDGWKDIYVANDYLTNDLIWMNNADGTFTNRASDFMKHTSHSAMGCDVTDLNNDGLADIVTLDMMPEDNYRRKTMLQGNSYTSYLNNDRYGYDYQYVRNTLQLNLGARPDNGDLLFSEMAMFAGISGTDWSWTPLIADFDHSGYRDLIVTNGFPRDITDRDFIDYHMELKRFMSKEKLREAIPSVKLKNYAYRNRGSAAKVVQFEDVTAAWGISEPTFSNGAAYADLDNDGDLDYIVNNINQAASVFQNYTNERAVEGSNWLQIQLKGTAKNPMGIGTFITLEYDGGKQQVWEHNIYRGYLSSMQSIAHFGLGAIEEVDKITIEWPNGKQQILQNVGSKQVLQVDIKNAQQRINSNKKAIVKGVFQEISDSLGIDFIQEESDYIDFNVQPLLPHKLSQYGPSISVGDVNGDGFDDFYVGGSHFKKGSFFLQNKDGTFEQKDLLEGENGDAKKEEELGTLLFDADLDGDLDLYLVSGGYEFQISDTAYQDRLFLNENGQFRLAKNALPEFLSSGSCVKASDFDQDGDLDLFVGGRVLPNEYPKPVSSYLLRNDTENGQVKFSIVNDELAPELNQIGLVCDALWTDFDNDKDIDLIIAGEWMPITFLENQEGKLIKNPSLIPTHKGWWNSLVAADFDLDGDIDYIAGNLGQNSLYQAREGQAVAIYANDFDGNGGFDAIPSGYFRDKEGKRQEFPFFNRMDVQKQVLPVREYFPRHENFGIATMPVILEKFDTEGMLQLEANHLSSSYIENLGNGEFAIKDLSQEAQVAPIYGMLARDFNGDNLPDILMTGNDYGTEVGMGRYDAFNGLLLLGDGQGNFRPTTMQESGICIPKDGKSLVQLRAADGSSLFIAGQNQGPLKAFKPTTPTGKFVYLQALDASALIELKNGRSYRVDLPYGDSFLSQSGRKLCLPEDAVRFTIFDSRGEVREEISI